MTANERAELDEQISAIAELLDVIGRRLIAELNREIRKGRGRC